MYIYVYIYIYIYIYNILFLMFSKVNTQWDQSTVVSGLNYVNSSIIINSSNSKRYS